MPNKNIMFILLLISSIFSSETFNLKDGSSIIGERISENENSIIIKTSYGQISINKNDLVIKNYKIELISGEILIGNKIQENDFFITLKTSGIGEIKVNKNEILSIQELNNFNQDSSKLVDRKTYYSPLGGVLGGFDSKLNYSDKDADFTIGEEELIDLFMDPTGHTLKERTLYLSGLSFGVGITDRFQITTNWGSFIWGNLNLRPKFKLLEKGNWEKQHSLSIGMHLNNRWFTTDKFKWQSGHIDYNQFSVEQDNSGSRIVDNENYNPNYGKWKQTAPMETVKKYWGSFEPIGSTVTYSSQLCDFPEEYDPNSVYDANAEDGIGVFDEDPRSYCSQIQHEEDWPYHYMTEFFGAYTFSKARKNFKGRISHTIGGNIQAIFIDNGNKYEPTFLYRAYYGLDVDISSKLKVISEIFYDPYYFEWWRLSDMDHDNDSVCADDYEYCDWELRNLSNEEVSKDNIIPLFLDFGIVYAFNNNLRVAIHFQKPFIGFYWKF